MSKINVDEIKVGDLISFTGYNGSFNIGCVVRIEEDRYWCHWNTSAKDVEGFLRYEDIEGHWKVINFEEEAKVDELKVYTGKDTLEALLEGKVLQYGHPPMKLKLENKQALLDINRDGNWEEPGITLQRLLDLKFTEVVTPQVGDWVKMTHTYSYGGEERTTIHTAQLTKVQGELMWAQWDDTGNPGYYRFTSEDISWQILTPEEVSEHKRKQAFAKVGRKLNEFKSGDIVMIDSEGVIGVVVSKNNTGEIKINEFNKMLQGWNAKPHQLTPISFVEQQVDLS